MCEEASEYRMSFIFDFELYIGYIRSIRWLPDGLPDLTYLLMRC